MIERKLLAPNNRKDIPLQQLLGVQFATPKYPKSNERPRIFSHGRPGKGVQGESVNK
jgi:hypothetical protein